MVKMQPEINRIKAKHFGDADRIADEQSKIFKREKYNPLASLIPLAVQIILLMGLVEVIYHPLDYLLHMSQDVITAFNGLAISLGRGESGELFRSAYGSGDDQERQIRRAVRCIAEQSCRCGYRFCITAGREHISGFLRY